MRAARIDGAAFSRTSAATANDDEMPEVKYQYSGHQTESFAPKRLSSEVLLTSTG
jgi:hypothetical protein